jgi:hypothetical protein
MGVILEAWCASLRVTRSNYEGAIRRSITQHVIRSCLCDLLCFTDVAPTVWAVGDPRR